MPASVKKVTLQISTPATSKNVGTTSPTQPTQKDIAEAVQKIEERPEIVKASTVSSSTVSSTATLEDLLVKRPTETPEFFAMRRAYAYATYQVLTGQINERTAILLSEVATNRAVYGVTYPTEITRVLDYINNKIL